MMMMTTCYITSLGLKVELRSTHEAAVAADRWTPLTVEVKVNLRAF